MINSYLVIFLNNDYLEYFLNDSGTKNVLVKQTQILLFYLRII